MNTVTRNIPLVSFSGNPMVIRVNSDNFLDGNNVPRPHYMIFCDIYTQDPGVGNPAPYHTDSIQVDADGNGEFDISAIINALTEPSYPWPLNHSNIVSKDAGGIISFWYKIYEGYGSPFVAQAPFAQSAEMFAIPGGFSDQLLAKIDQASSDQYTFLLANKLFLTNQPRIKRVMNNQPEVLRFFNATEIEFAKVILTEHNFHTGAITTKYLWEGTLDALSVYNINVTPGGAFTLDPTTDFWCISVAGDTYKLLSTEDDFVITTEDDIPIIVCTNYNELVSEVINYRLADLPVRNFRSFLFQNSMGGFDSVFATGEFSTFLEGDENISYRVHKTALRNALLPHQERLRAVSVMNGAIGYFSAEELTWLQDLFRSEQKFIVHEGEKVPMVLRRKEHPVMTDRPPQTISIEAVLAVDSHYSLINPEFVYT